MKKYFLGALIVGLGIVGFAFFNIPNASAAPRSPGCQLSSNPQTATGGTVTLVYTVKYLPTTISIRADDNSATPPGTPTVGAPDPARADSQQTGSIVTGPITKDTVFTMKVSNSKGTNDCEVEVPFVATPGSNLRLPLVATLLDLPNQMVYPGPLIGNQNIQSAAYSNGVFAFSGACGGPKDQNYLSSYPPFRQGGARFFKDDGTFIVERDLCMDGGTIAQSLYMHGGGASRIVADGDRGFFMAVRSHAGSDYGPAAKRAGYYQVAGNSILFSPSSNFIVRDIGSHVAANGKVVGEVQVSSDGNSGRNVTLSTPSLQILAQREEFSVRPLIGFGDYIIGGTDSSQGTCKSPITPYGIPTVFRPEADGSLTSVEGLTLPDGLCPAKMAIDYTTSPKRLAVTAHTGQSGRNLNFSNRIFLFTSGANGLEPAGELTIPESVLSDINRPNFALFPAFAVAGPYLVFAGQAGGDERYFTLWRDGELKGVAQAPLRRDYGSEIIGEAARQPTWLYMTPQGKIMAAGIYNAYLFDSNVVPGGGVVPPVVPPVYGGGGDGGVPGCLLPTSQVSGTSTLQAGNSGSWLGGWAAYTDCVIRKLYPRT